MAFTCAHKEICSGCPWIDLERPQQQERKTQKLMEGLGPLSVKNFEFIDLGPGALRERADLTFEDGQLGFYSKDRSGIFAVKECPQLNPPLQNWLSEVREISFPIKKGSLRLRVSPEGKKGIWLDFANQDIKALLEERNLLSSLLDRAVVEVGQKRKRLGWKEDQLKLLDLEYNLWTRTWMEQRSIDLFSLVGTFSQTGTAAMKCFADIFSSWTKVIKPRHTVEFGSGSGGLTFPLLSHSEKISVFESDTLSLGGLRKTLEREKDLATKVEIFDGDFQSEAKSRQSKDLLTTADLIAVNPPRSGLKGFLAPFVEMPNPQRPPYFIYMSCFLDSFLADVQTLTKIGYTCTDLKIVDQFPQTDHFEILSLWKK